MRNHIRGNPEALSKDDRPFNEVQASTVHVKGGEPTMGKRIDHGDAFLGEVVKTFGIVEEAVKSIATNNIRMDAAAGELEGAAGTPMAMNRGEAYVNNYNKAAAKRDVTASAIALDEAINTGKLRGLTPEEGEKLYTELTKPTSDDATYMQYHAALISDSHARWTAAHHTLIMEEGIEKTANNSFKVVLDQYRKGDAKGAFVSLGQTLTDLHNMGDNGKAERMMVENTSQLLGSMAYNDPDKWTEFGMTKLANGTLLKDSQYAVHYELGRLRATQERERQLEEAQRKREEEARRQREIARLQAIVSQNQMAASGERGIESLILQGTPGATILESMKPFKPYADDPNYKAKIKAYNAMCSTYNMYRTSMFKDPVGTIKSLYARAGMGAPSIQDCTRIAKSYGVPNSDLIMSEGAAVRWAETIRKNPDQGTAAFLQSFRGQESAAWKTLSHFSSQSQLSMIYTQMSPEVRTYLRPLATNPQDIKLDKKKLASATTRVASQNKVFFSTLQQNGMNSADIASYQRNLAVSALYLSEQQGVSINEAVSTISKGVTSEFVTRSVWSGATHNKVMLPKAANVSNQQISESTRNFDFALSQGRLITFYNEDGTPITREKY